ncbi:hypothetical protein D9Q98_003175 [Chlorella vulgaris]|uniref:Uncharacterized protein n=1 Tax=Chlorella vulgaris TaxID=3077 RepID=A0A9D4TS88_CHLVU|nr:hypothetical protein D9Q98_003175 [Chlorella vulgaris]
MVAAAADALLPVARGLASAAMSAIRSAGRTPTGTVILRRSPTADSSSTSSSAGVEYAVVEAAGAQVLTGTIGGAGRQLQAASARAAAVTITSQPADATWAGDAAAVAGAPVALPIIPSGTSLRKVPDKAADKPTASPPPPSNAATPASSSQPMPTPAPLPASSKAQESTDPSFAPLSVTEKEAAGAPPSSSTSPPSEPASSSVDGAGKLEQMLQALSAAAASPDVQADPKFEPVQKLLAAAPAAGEPRAKFAVSLLKGIDSVSEDDSSSVFGLARVLLEKALDENSSGNASGGSPAALSPTAAGSTSTAAAATASPAAAPAPAATGFSSSNGGKYDALLSALTAAASASDLELDDRFDPLRVLLASAPEDPERRHNFARSLLQGIEGVQEGDYTSPFALAKILLERSLDNGALPTDEAGPSSIAAAAAAPSSGSASSPPTASTGSSGGAASKHEQMLQTLLAAAASPDIKANPKFFAVRKLLAAAPASGEPRAKFAASLLKGIDSAAEDDSSSVFGSARMLLEVALEDASV